MNEPNLAKDVPVAPIHARLGIELIEATRDRVVATMPVEGNTQPFGLLHGGASILLAESLGSIGAALACGGERTVVGIEVSASHHRSTAVGTVTGRARPIHAGRTLSTWEVVVSDDEGRTLTTARVTCLLRDGASQNGRG